MITKPIRFLTEVWEELGKVTWPTRDEAIRMTLTVIIVSALIAALIGGLDYILTGIVTKILSR